MSVPPEIFAFVLVIESSCIVASEASYFLSRCVPTILKRMLDARGRGNIQLKTAVVTYGTSDNIPTPILFRRNFVDWPEVYSRIQSGNWSHFQLGMTNTPGPSGMSALEGLVAAVELFQDYDNTTKANVSKYIIHVASSDPDAFVNPVWNNIPELDDVTWESLPDQFKERNINYNLMTTRNKSETFARLFAKTSEGKATQPWFPLQPHNSVLLAGIPAAPAPAPPLAPATPATQPKATPKRPNEAAPDQTRQDPKRPRISDSPSQAAAKPPAPTTKIATPKIPPAPVPTPPPSIPTPTQAPAPVPAPAPAPLAAPTAASAPTDLDSALSVMIGKITTLNEVNAFGAKLHALMQKSQVEMKAAKERNDQQMFNQAAKEYTVKMRAMMALKAKHQALGGPSQQQGQPAAQGPGAQQARGPQHNPGMAGPSPAGGFNPNTPGNHPTGPQFGSPSMPPAANITMNQVSSSMNPMVSAQHQAHALQVQMAQAQARAQGQVPTPGQGGGPGSAASRMGMPPGQSQPPVNPADMERQYQEVLDWNRKLSQKSDASNRPIPPHPAPPPPQAAIPIPQELANALAQSTQPEPVSPVDMMNKYQKVSQMMQQQNSQIQVAIALVRLRQDATAEVIKKGVREKSTFPNFVDNQRPGGLQSVWKGTLKWPANFGRGGVREAAMKVHALHHDPASCHAHTWAQNILLQPAPKPAEMAGHISAWLNKHQPVVCLIDIPNDTPEPQQMDYKKLYLQLQLALVRPEGYYAYAQWTNPTNHEQTTNAIFFTIGPKLVGAFFPLTGFPELPHEVAISPPILWEFMGHHWRPDIVTMVKAYLDQVKPELKTRAGQEMIQRIRHRIQENQAKQMKLIVEVNGGLANREALNSFVMQPLTLPSQQQIQLAQHAMDEQRRRQQIQANAQHQVAQLQQQQRQAMMAAMMNNGATGGMLGMGNMGGMNMNNMGNMGGMNMGAGMPNMANMGNTMNMGGGMPNMANMGNMGGISGGGNMGMGGMQNIGNMGGMGAGIPNMGNMGGVNMNLGNMGGMGGHGGQQQ